MEFLKTRKIVVSVVLAAMLSNTANASLSDFVSNSLDTAVLNQNAGYFKSQAGGLMSLGSSRIRFGGNNGAFTPFNVQDPSLNIGCSGIDMVFGGFSYLNFDNIVEKLKKITTAAPAFAFKIALSTLCKDCDTIMTELEKIANAINGMNFDTCTALNNWSDKITGSLASNGISTGIGAGVVGDWLSGFGEGLGKSISDFTAYIHGQGGNNQGKDGSDAVKNVFKQGSLIKYIVEGEKNRTGFFKTAMGADYEDILRDLLGDVIGFTEKNGEEVKFRKELIQGSLDITRFVEALYKGTAGEKAELEIQVWNIVENNDGTIAPPTQGTPKKVKVDNFIDAIMDRINEIIIKGRGNNKLSADDQSFLGSLSQPTLQLINAAIANPDLNISAYSEVIAAQSFADLMNIVATEIEVEISKGINDQSIAKREGGGVTALSSGDIGEITKTFSDRFTKLRNQINVVIKQINEKNQTAIHTLREINRLVGDVQRRTQN